SLESLSERLTQVDDLSKRTAAQYDGLKQSRTDLETLRKDILEFHKSHAEIAQLRDKLGADRAALEAFGDRLTSFRARTPELEATMDAILGKLGQVDEGTKQATRLGEVAGELDAQLTRLTSRIQFVDKLEARINTLHVMTADVGEQVKRVQALGEELNRASAAKDGRIAELARTQARQRDAVAQDEAAEDQLKRAEAMYKSLEQRRTQLAFSEKKMSTIEAKMAELAQKSSEIEQKMKALAEREAVVNAVKA